MSRASLGISIITSVLIGIALGAGLFQLAGFCFFGGLGGLVARRLKRGSERVYWLCCGSVLALAAFAFLGAGVSGFVLVAPIVFTASYFTARIGLRLTNQYSKLPE